MSKINDGGPAFPAEPHAMAGMTLLDYFAAKALPAIFSDYCSAARETGFDHGWRDYIAANAYEMADAMLKARSQK
jgi:hypothetical protein